jgi:DNA polymerase-1
MRIEPLQQEGYRLLHEGTIALSAIESTGIRVDMKKLEWTKTELNKRIEGYDKELKEDRVWKKHWLKRYGDKANLGSRKQLATVLMEDLNFTPTKFTAKKNVAVDEEVLMGIDESFIKLFLKMVKYQKALDTFISGIERGTIDGILHAVFNLHTARSYRSSSEDPNFQNLPVRDKEMAQLIRSLFIPRLGNVLAENDFKGIEVGVSACYHKDQNFISYITTPGKDMHRDMAAQIYMLKPEEVSKDSRYGAKNKFVFPQFYGDYYVACARNLWEWITKGKLTGPGGISLMDHLKKKGIKKLGACDPEEEPEPGTFEKHLQDVEKDFWGNRFMAYGQWRKEWYYAYLEKGYFDLHTGFRIYGVYGRNAVTNYPVQGSAFHCLLWCLIQIVNKLLPKYKLRARVVGQIHDSLIGDVPVGELRDYLEIVEETVTVRLREHYKSWLIVPLEIEYEICPSNGTWFDKREIKFKQGVFTHPEKPDLKTKDPQKFVAVLDRLKKFEKA